MEIFWFFSEKEPTLQIVQTKLVIVRAGTVTAAYAMWRFLLLLYLVSAVPALAQAPGGPARASPQAHARQTVDPLFTALQAAPDEATAAVLEVRIEHLWLQAGSPAFRLLMTRGMRGLKAGVPAEAEADFDAAIVLEPGNTEAWHRRSVARLNSGDLPGAVVDIGEALQREPRNFAALDTLTRLSEARKDWKGAYAAWQKKLEIDPKTPGGEEKLKDLRRRALGEAT